ncbi:ECI2 [Symbiodinium sp. KB8]|nr:ECI2 [Symbiodinium sp. KB8]
MLSLVSRAAARGAACAAALPSSLMPGAQAAWLHSSRAVWADEAAFLKAKEAITAVPSVDNMDKLKLYALFKQATVGANDTKAPGMLDFVGKAKWDAWTKLGDMSKEDAMQAYIDTAKSLGADVDGTGSSSAAAADAPAASPGEYTAIKVDVSDRVMTITMDRPSKRNAITFEMYMEIQAAMDAAAADDSVSVVVLTGSGEFYSAGNDLSNFTKAMPPGGPAELAEQAAVVLEGFVGKFIDFPKVLVAAVNGPAVGIPVTTLALCDIVYASSTATFHTPFTALGQSPEACSSVLFPAIMGPSRANELLLFGKKIDAETAAQWGLVSEVFEASSFQEQVSAKVKAGAALFPQSMKLSKGIIRQHDREALHAANKEEVALIKTRWVSDECMQAIMNFMNRKK